MTRTRFTLLLGFAVAAVLGGSGASAGDRRPVVVELFTSQGCSSCPPADELLGRLADRPGVLAMSFPITYWDMLGWKDTLATDANTRRQKAYAQAMGHGGVYTPQIIVDGIIDVVGSREASVEMAIAKRTIDLEMANARQEILAATREVAASREATIAAREQALAEAAAYREAGRAEMEATRAEMEAARKAALAAARAMAPASSIPVPVSIAELPDRLRIAVGGGEAKDDRRATVWLFHLRNTVIVNVGAGENGGHSMTYRNVVSDVRPVGTWKGDAMTIDLPRAPMAGLPQDELAVVVQQGGYGRILGATTLRPDARER